MIRTITYALAAMVFAILGAFAVAITLAELPPGLAAYQIQQEHR